MINENPILPTIHLNGTSKCDILERIREARCAINAASHALRRATPHPRDYYPQGDGAFNEAKTQHFARMKALDDVSEELSFVYRKIVGEGE